MYFIRCSGYNFPASVGVQLVYGQLRQQCNCNCKRNKASTNSNSAAGVKTTGQKEQMCNKKTRRKSNNNNKYHSTIPLKFRIFAMFLLFYSTNNKSLMYVWELFKVLRVYQCTVAVKMYFIHTYIQKAQLFCSPYPLVPRLLLMNGIMLKLNIVAYYFTLLRVKHNKFI